MRWHCDSLNYRADGRVQRSGARRRRRCFGGGRSSMLIPVEFAILWKRRRCITLLRPEPCNHFVDLAVERILPNRERDEWRQGRAIFPSSRCCLTCS